MNLIFNTTKMKYKLLQHGLIALAFAVGTTAVAQTTDTADTGLVKDAGDGVSVKIVDNKGTIKYLQTNNGITSITSTTSGSLTTTTWQLGGTLTDDTYFDVDGNAFALDGLKLETGAASTDATTESDHGTGTGWTLVVRDEATGEFRKLLATNLVKSGYGTATAAAGDETAGSITIPVTGIPTLIGNEGKIAVYRNGAKLLHTTDFTVTAGESVTIAEVSGSWELYAGDVFEVQWVK
jgi:hypothetical protein